jgi:hypothetical protein
VVPLIPYSALILLARYTVYLVCTKKVSLWHYNTIRSQAKPSSHVVHSCPVRLEATGWATIHKPSIHKPFIEAAENHKQFIEAAASQPAIVAEGQPLWPKLAKPSKPL